VHELFLGTYALDLPYLYTILQTTTFVVQEYVIPII
jgi:hypothetical protein